jgi:hypothetical protein
MERSNQSNLKLYLITALTCGLGAAFIGFVLFVSNVYPQESTDLLAAAWAYLCIKLSFVGTAAGFLWFVFTYPFVKAYAFVVDAGPEYWISLFSAYLWFNCIGYSLELKGIKTTFQSCMENTAGWLGLAFMVSVYMICIAKAASGFDIVFSFMLVTFLFFLKVALEGTIMDRIKNKRERSSAKA